MGGVWPVYPYVLYEKPKIAVLELLDNDTIWDTTINQCLREFGDFYVAPSPCDVGGIIKWKILNGKKLYAYELKICLYPSDGIQDMALAKLGDCNHESSDLIIKCKRKKHFVLFIKFLLQLQVQFTYNYDAFNYDKSFTLEFVAL